MGVRAFVVFVTLGAAACGPVQYVSQVTRRASAEVAAARAAGADSHKGSIYHYTLAVEYLHKAREEAGYADYQAAIRFGKKAETHAKKARDLAQTQADDEPTGDDAPVDPSETPVSGDDEQ